MCVLVQYVSPVYKKVVTKLLKLISLDARDCSVSKLFKVLKNLLKEKKIPLKNIEMACDNALVINAIILLCNV